MLPIGLLAGFGLESISQGKRRFIAVVIITVAAFDLLSFSYSLSQQAFILPSVVPAPEPAPTPIAYTLDQHTIRVDGVDHTRAYASLVSGYGTMSYCSVLGPDPAVKTVQHEEDNSFLTFTDPGAKASLTQWSPNKLSVDVEATGKNYIIVNANYAKGWLVNGEPARDIQQRLAFPVSSGKHQLTFAYQPPGLKTGSVISLATILLAIFIGFVSRYRLNNKVG